MQLNLRGFVLAFVLSLTVTAVAWAERQAVVTLNTGRQLKGEVVDDGADSITLRISGINTKIKRTDIKSVKFLKTTDEEYKERRAKVDDDDVDGRYEIARWLFDQKAYTLALKELNELTKISPDHQKVGLLRRVVILKIGEDANNNNNTNNGNNNQDPGPNHGNNANNGNNVNVGPLPTKMLDAESINKLKVFEIDFKTNPKIFISRDVIEEMFENYAGKEGVPDNPNDKRLFLRKKPDEILKIMFALRARELYGKVQVRDDPPAFAAFRQKVHRNVVVNHCATAKCHGGENAGKLFLFNKGINSPTTIYTNFYILNQFKNKAGFMIDRDFPEKSLLLTYALPDNATPLPHPKVKGWQPLFRIGQKDRAYKAALDWVSTLYKPVPQYDVKYKVPSLPARLPKANGKAEPVGKDGGGE